MGAPTSRCATVPDLPLSQVVDELVARMLEPLGLDRWQVRVVFGPGDETAACNAMPEYRTLVLAIDPDRLSTGDELDETIAHELCHAIIWPIASMADDLVLAVVEMLPEMAGGAMARLLKEQVRKAEEDTTTHVGRMTVGLLRRVWAGEEELGKLRTEVRALKRKADAA